MSQPTHSVEAEQSLLGGLLIDNSAIDRVVGVISTEDFYRDDHRRIHTHITRLIEAGLPADVVTVFESMTAEGTAEQAGGMGYLSEIANNTPSSANIRRYAEIVRDRATRRRLASIGADLQQEAITPSGLTTSDILDKAQRVILDVGEAANTSGPAHVGAALGDFINLLDRRMNGEIVALPTGFIDLDRHLDGGMSDGDLIIIAGRPAMGKTTLAMNIAQHSAMVSGAPTLVFSMEMSAVQIVDRLASSVARVPLENIRLGKLSDDQSSQIVMAIGKVNESPLYLDDTPALTIMEIRARARAIRRKAGALRLIVIDYIQLMSSHGRSENREKEIGIISRGLKALAKECACPVIALSQLSRKCEERTDKRPVMSDLRESGSIEQDADVVLMCYREEYYNEETHEKGIAEAIARKVRNGKTGTVRLAFRGDVCRFENLQQA